MRQPFSNVNGSAVLWASTYVYPCERSGDRDSRCKGHISAPTPERRVDCERSRGGAQKHNAVCWLAEAAKITRFPADLLTRSRGVVRRQGSSCTTQPGYVHHGTTPARRPCRVYRLGQDHIYYRGVWTHLDSEMVLELNYVVMSSLLDSVSIYFARNLEEKEMIIIDKSSNHH
jgi:hypothetical protein